MRVDAMMGEADGEGEKEIMIQSLRAMVDGLKHQISHDQDALEASQVSPRSGWAQGGLDPLDYGSTDVFRGN